MQLKLTTTVAAKLETVKAGFTSELFLSLNPPFPKVNLVRFDGCQTGDIIHLELNFWLFKQSWIGRVSDEGQLPAEWFFVDEGDRLPFFLSKWSHRHRVISRGEGVIIVDEITYTTGTFLTDLLMYPLLLGQFLYRKPIYKSFFTKSG